MGYNSSQSFFSGQPPLVVFTICLTAFGCTMIVLAYVIGGKEVPNPDVQMDWNKFFKRVSDLNLCPASDEAATQNNKGTILHPKQSVNSSTSHVVDESKSMSAVLSDVVNSAMNEKWQGEIFVDVSVKVLFLLHEKLPTNSNFLLKGTVKGSLLGLPGKYSHLLFNMSLSFLPTKNDSCLPDTCYPYEVCILVSLPSKIIPKTKMPETCAIDSQAVKELGTMVLSEYTSPSCLSLEYTSEDKLTEMLSPQDRSIVNLHLMHTSYFMFVMVMTLVCVSLIRGRMRQTKNYLALQKVPSVT